MIESNLRKPKEKDMEVMWEAEWAYTPIIKRREVIRETEHCVFIKSDSRWDKNGERRLNKATSSGAIFRTWDEARKAVFDHQESRVKGLRVQLERENGVLGNIKGWRQPEEPTDGQ